MKEIVKTGKTSILALFSCNYYRGIRFGVFTATEAGADRRGVCCCSGLDIEKQKQSIFSRLSTAFHGMQQYNDFRLC